MAFDGTKSQYYRDQAARIRDMAKEFRFPEVRDQLENIARQFDYLAERSEGRQPSVPVDSAFAGDKPKPGK